MLTIISNVLLIIIICFLLGRFFPLLAKQRLDHPECDVLRNVFALLFVKNVHSNTVTMVMNMTESLLISPDFEPTENESELIVNNCVIPEAEQNYDSTGTESRAVVVFTNACLFFWLHLSFLFLQILWRWVAACCSLTFQRFFSTSVESWGTASVSRTKSSKLKWAETSTSSPSMSVFVCAY